MRRLLIVLLVLSTVFGCAQRTARGLPDGQLVSDFESRIGAYADLRDRLDEGRARLKETRKPEEITAAQQALAARIQDARAAARHGDIFTPANQARFRHLLNPELRGRRGRNTRGIIMDENPGAFPLKVNGPYPTAEEPLATIPPNILAALPVLPQDIEYRFVGKHLVLRDTRANLIIDYIPNAIS